MMPGSASELRRFLGDADRIYALREVLRDARYRSDTLVERAGAADSRISPVKHSGLFSLLHADALRSRDEAVDTLLLLFWLLARVPSERYVTALPVSVRLLLEAAGLVSCARGSISATVCIVEIDGRWFLADRLFENTGRTLVAFAEQEDGAMPPHCSSLEMQAHASAARSSGRRMIDIGSGSGYLSMALGARFNEVVGIDVSPRAVAFAQANAILNDARATYAVHDAWTYDDPIGADVAVFNAPWRPSWTGDQPRRHSTHRVADFIRERVPHILRPGGVLELYGLFETSADSASASTELGSDLALASPDVAISVIEVPDSSFCVDAEAVRRRRLPPLCTAVGSPREAEQLLDYLAAGSSVLSPALVTVCLRA